MAPLGLKGEGFTSRGGHTEGRSGGRLLDCKMKPSLASYSVHTGFIYYSKSKVSYTSINEDKHGLSWYSGTVGR